MRNFLRFDYKSVGQPRHTLIGIQKSSLSELAVNERAVVLSLASRRLETSRLASLGITPGALVEMTQNYGRGPLIVTVRNTRVALGRGEATQILIKRNSE